MMKLLLEKKEALLLSVLLVVSFLVRFIGLGYSHFYGDETKTFYLDKTVPATEFFLNQRKGPLQFFVVWITEKIVGGYNELFTRVPFALAGFLGVVMFYLVVKKLFDYKVALVSTLLFSFSGFNLAFSRTIQYQSFLVLFGLLAVYFIFMFTKLKKTKHLVLSSLFLAFAFYAHYDALLFLFPVFYLLVTTKKKKKLQVILSYFILPLLLLVSIFYVPYVAKGYFEDNVVGYLSRRFNGGNEMGLNHSLYTIFVYNPTAIVFVVLLFSFYIFFEKKFANSIKMLLFWLFGGFVIFELLILNPGTHISNYLLPLYILSGYSILGMCNCIKSVELKYVYSILLSVVVGGFLITNVLVFVPVFNKGYPWKNYENLHEKYQLFVYGFPYNRGWDQIRNYMRSQTGARGVYTNDNDTIAEYYLRGYDYTPPGSNFLPQYYVHIYDNQEFTGVNEDEKWEYEFLSNYGVLKEFYVGGDLVSTVFKLSSN